MNKGCLFGGGILGLIILAGIVLVMYGFGINNNMVKKDETVKQAWNNVQSAYQRRSDLIGNLVNTVKGAAKFEQETLTKVIEARASATAVKIDPSNITPAQLAKFQEAQSGLQNAFSKLMMVSEQYPQLRANQNFLELQSQIEGTENRIKVERDRFNETIMDYNSYVRVVPNNLVASYAGFQVKEGFKADAGSQNAPKVEF